MCPLLETIKCENGALFNLEYHQQRFDFSRAEYFGAKEKIRLNEIIQIPAGAQEGLYRCRVIYAENMLKIEFIPHTFRKVKTLKLLAAEDIDYKFKYADRTRIEQLFSKQEDCDDILIVKNGLITDTSIANVVFRVGSNWWTPDKPLLKGTRRASYLSEGKIRECRIGVNDLARFEAVKLINAMQGLDDQEELSVANIVF